VAATRHGSLGAKRLLSSVPWPQIYSGGSARNRDGLSRVCRHSRIRLVPAHPGVLANRAARGSALVQFGATMTAARASHAATASLVGAGKGVVEHSKTREIRRIGPTRSGLECQQ